MMRIMSFFARTFRAINKCVPIGLCLLSPAVWAIPTQPVSAISSSEVIRVIGGLLLVLLVIVFLSWLVKRLHGIQLNNSKGFATISTMTLGPKERIILVKVGDRYLLLGAGSGTVTTLCDFGDQLPEGFEPGNTSSFSSYLKSAVGKV